MKYVTIALLLCAFASTGFSKPIEDEATIIQVDYSAESDFLRSLVDSMIVDLETVEEGLKQDGQYLELGRVKIIKNALRVFALSPLGSKSKALSIAMNQGVEVIRKHAQYFNKKSPWILYSADDDEEQLSKLDKLREQLTKLRNNLKERRSRFRLKIVEANLRVLDTVVEKLKKHDLDESKFAQIVQRIKQLLENFAEKESKPSLVFSEDDAEEDVEPEDLDKEEEAANDEKADEDVPKDKEEKKERLTRLQKIRKRLADARDSLRSRRKNLQARILDTYLNVLDRLIKRLKDNRLGKTRYDAFVNRVTELLEKYAEKKRN